jgi:hypothetical protein
MWAEGSPTVDARSGGSDPCRTIVRREHSTTAWRCDARSDLAGNIAIVAYMANTLRESCEVKAKGAG